MARTTLAGTLVAAVLAAACGGASDGQPAQSNAAAPAAGVTAAPSDVVAIPEDSTIFEETMAWAQQQRLDTLDTGPLMAALGRRFVGAPYEPGTLDPPGPERLIINLRTFDCVTYVETMLAMARVLRAGDPSFAAFARALSRIRYAPDVPPAYPTRLHYFSHWIEANDTKGLVQGLTSELGGVPDPEPIGFMSSHVASYRQLADTAFLAEIVRTEQALTERGRFYIPEDSIAGVASRIRDGDIIAATSTLPGLDVAHTGLALWIDGRLHLMHAPLVGSVVEISEEPLADRIRRIASQDGIMVARPR
jgi:hypothetical protein